MKSLRIVFMGSPAFALPSLQRLKESHHRLVGVVTRPDRPRGRGCRVTPTPVKSWAMERELTILQPASLSENSFMEQLGELAPDLICTAAFGRILPRQVLQFPACGCINLHASLLPAYRGAAPIQRAILNGESRTGVTVIYMEEKLDAGDIILQDEEPIEISDTAGDLYSRLSEKGSLVLKRAVDLIAAGRCEPVPQDLSRVTYAPPLHAGEEIIIWNNSTRAIYDQIRGFNPRPGAYTIFRGGRLKIWEAKLPHGNSEAVRKAVPGEVVFIKGEVRVKTGDGDLRITGVQPQGKKRLHAADFWRGYRLQEGEILG